jgi:hypothetical protein
MPLMTRRRHNAVSGLSGVLTSVVVLVPTLLLVGCDALQSTESRQIKACADDVRSTLNDPGSMEILSTRAFKATDGTHRLELIFTAKNGVGGTVRSDAVCGFKTELDTELNPDDLFNKTRRVQRNLSGH